MNWYRETEQELIEVAAAVQSQRPFRMERLETLAADLIVSLKQNDALVIEALSGPSGTVLITNLINVGILGTKIGIGLGYYGQELDRLALAGLLHDIGLFAVPASIVTKTGRLTQDERLLIEQHPELGCQAIHRAGTAYQWLAQVIRQVHERYNGQGYPNKLKGREISETTQILGAVDVFDALVSERPYRRRMLPHQAIKELLTTEQASFPREILKALVQQLSVYPLGTTVRLTTGEVGTVDRINSRYPLRPVVKVRETDRHTDAEIRQVDLCLTPLVSIVETLDPPAVGRVMFSAAPQKVEVASMPGAVSDQFTSLLENLDAIATAIQGVVETRILESQTADNRGVTTGARMVAPVPPPSPQGGDGTFRKEIVGLFALEAREWLAQIQTALKKLGAGVEGPVRSKLYGFILSGIMNLARSASTVQLSHIEAMASNLLPILHDVGVAGMGNKSEALRPLHDGLDRIATAVRRLAGDPSDLGLPIDKLEWPAPASQKSDTDATTGHNGREQSEPMPERVAASIPLLKAMRELQQTRARSVQPARDVLEAVILRATQEVGEREDQISPGAIMRILRDLDRSDELFLEEIHERVPMMRKVLMELREEGATNFMTASQLAPLLIHIDILYEVARNIQAATMLLLLQGVKSFLTAAAFRKLDSLPQRLQAVEERLMALIPMAEQWVTLGRLERAAIEEILPA